MKHRLAFQAALTVGIAFAVPAAAKDVMQTKTAGAYRIELHVLPAEPFYAADEAAAKHATMGMVIEGGAAPVQPDAAAHPNHHLVVHVFDQKTGQAITDAKVSLSFEPLGRGNKPAGASVEVPVVNMQAISQGPKSTHYGNNVVMPPGSLPRHRHGQRQEGGLSSGGERYAGSRRDDGRDENALTPWHLAIMRPRRMSP